MNLKILIIINNEEKNLKKIVNEFALPFNTVMHGEGTATQGILDFLGLVKTSKNIMFSIIPDILENEIFNYLNGKTKIKELGNGIAFTVPLSSSSKYLQEEFRNREGEKVQKKADYHLIVTVVNDGSGEKIMNSAKKYGANGGTLINGRSIGGKTFKLFNLTLEPEKDIIFIVCKDEEKNKIMNGILEKNGMNTDNHAMCFSIPIDSVAGIGE